KHYTDMQGGDVLSTSPDSSELYETIGLSPDTPVNYGVQQLVDWYISFYHGKK
ncbi:capsular biosynthesis protein CpsI, partial [Morganella morganii]|nr:capsular biosynthesis protein CpsI [Morganella morganii]